MFIPIAALRRHRHSRATRLLFLVVAAGLLIGTGLRGGPHSHHDDGLAEAHHALLTIDHTVPSEVPDAEPAAAHFHYAALLVFVASPAEAILPAGLRPLGVLRTPEDFPPPPYEAEMRHRPPIA